MYLVFQKFMKRSQTKFQADPMIHSKVVRSKKSNFIIRSEFIIRSKLSCNRVVSRYWYFINVAATDCDMLLQI